MDVTVLAFGIAKDIVGDRLVKLTLPEQSSVKELRQTLEQSYPRLREIASYAVAVNNEYAYPADSIKSHDEIAIIPPVSGG